MKRTRGAIEPSRSVIKRSHDAIQWSHDVASPLRDAIARPCNFETRWYVPKELVLGAPKRAPAVDKLLLDVQNRQHDAG
jgi:hypothetical protein